MYVTFLSMAEAVAFATINLPFGGTALATSVIHPPNTVFYYVPIVPELENKDRTGLETVEWFDYFAGNGPLTELISTEEGKILGTEDSNYLIKENQNE